MPTVTVLPKSSPYTPITPGASPTNAINTPRIPYAPAYPSSPYVPGGTATDPNAPQSSPYIPGVTATAPNITPTIDSTGAKEDITKIQGDLTATQQAIEAQKLRIATDKTAAEAKAIADAKIAADAKVAADKLAADKLAAETPSEMQSVVDTPTENHFFAYQPDGTRLEVPLVPGVNPADTAKTMGLSMTVPTPNETLKSYGGVNNTTPLDSGGSVAVLGNGMKAMLDSNGNFVRVLSDSEYNSERANSNVYQKQLETNAASDIAGRMEGIRNGSIPLEPWQQDQLNGIAAEYAALIASQKIANANLEGGTRTFQGLLGMSQYSPGLAMGAINDVVDKGIAKIASLQTKMASTIGEMTSAFRKGNFEMLKTLYDQHTKNKEELQKNIDKIEIRFDTVIVDEIQDFHAMWVHVLLALLRSDGPRRFLTVGDEKQNLHGREGVQAVLAFRPTRAELRTNCRNAQRIGELLHSMGGAEVASASPEGEVFVIEANTIEEATEAVITEVQEMLHTEVWDADRILIATIGQNERQALLAASTDALRFTSYEESAEGTITCETVHRAKGLEYDVVVLVAPREDVRDQLMYVGASRAITRLVVIAPAPLFARMGIA
jgi:hypothetical protein